MKRNTTKDSVRTQRPPKRSTEGGLGQSEVLGVVLILGITVTAIGMIVAFGQPAITEGTELVEGGQVENEFSLLDSKLATSALGASDSQSIELNIQDGRLVSEPDGATITLMHNFTEADARDMNDTLGEDFYDALNSEPYNTTAHCADSCDNSNWDNDVPNILSTLNRTLTEIEMGKLEYTKNDRKLAYEGGGVWRQEGNNNESLMVSPPEFHYSRLGQTLTVPVFNITSDLAVSGEDRNIQVGTGSEPQNVFEENPVVGGTILAEIESDYFNAWASYFGDRTKGEVVEAEDGVATVELTVPSDVELDGGHSFSGSVPDDADLFNGNPEGNSFHLSPTEFIEDTLEEAKNNNNNSGTCLDGDNDPGGSSCSFGTGGGEALYYASTDDFGEIDFDADSGNITLVVDDDLTLRDDIEIESHNDPYRVEIMVVGGGNKNEILVNNADINHDETGEPEDMVVLGHSGLDQLRITGGGGLQWNATFYGPNVNVEWDGPANKEEAWNGGMVASSFDSTSNPNSAQEGVIAEGEEVDLLVGASSDTITYLHVTENRVFAE